MSLVTAGPLYWSEVITVRRAAVVQYVTTSEAAQRNRELIEDVLNELAAREHGGVELPGVGVR